jgi:hypothetical protein
MLSSSEIPFRTIVLSTILFSREMRTAIKAANAPRRNAGAAACEMTCESCVIEGVSEIMQRRLLDDGYEIQAARIVA